MSVLILLALLLAKGAQAGDGWGYNYDSLRNDLALWKKNPCVRVDSIGASVQGRAIWMLSISDSTDSLNSVPGRVGPKHRVTIHARTHSDEVQAGYVAREVVRFLLDTTAVSQAVRRDFVFDILPQFNPDGVELGIGRLNANNVDLESDWDKTPLQPEVASLKRLFEGFMAGSLPVEVALNLHSDQYNGTRFFVYHVEAGTSWPYTEQEKSFIAGVQGYFPGGIKNWDFLTSWQTGPAARYPEGFWWLNHHEAVMALTYEDNNSPTATSYDSTGRALVLGSVAYIRASHPLVRPVAAAPRTLNLTNQGVQCHVSGSRLDWVVVDLAGRSLSRGTQPPGESLLRWTDLAPGGSRILVATQPGLSRETLILPAQSR